MGWLDRRRRPAPAEAVASETTLFSDIAVPDLAAPLYARALVLERDGTIVTVEVQPPGMG